MAAIVDDHYLVWSGREGIEDGANPAQQFF
jgi:hypothetical protein